VAAAETIKAVPMDPKSVYDRTAVVLIIGVGERHLGERKEHEER
jgi:hypothetical protein